MILEKRKILQLCARDISGCTVRVLKTNYYYERSNKKCNKTSIIFKTFHAVHVIVHEYFVKFFFEE